MRDQRTYDISPDYEQLPRDFLQTRMLQCAETDQLGLIGEARTFAFAICSRRLLPSESGAIDDAAKRMNVWRLQPRGQLSVATPCPPLTRSALASWASGSSAIPLWSDGTEHRNHWYSSTILSASLEVPRRFSSSVIRPLRLHLLSYHVEQSSVTRNSDPKVSAGRCCPPDDGVGCVAPKRESIKQGHTLSVSHKTF